MSLEQYLQQVIFINYNIQRERAERERVFQSSEGRIPILVPSKTLHDKIFSFSMHLYINSLCDLISFAYHFPLLWKTKTFPLPSTLFQALSLSLNTQMDGDVYIIYLCCCLQTLAAYQHLLFYLFSIKIAMNQGKLSMVCTNQIIFGK